jgi:hypothetical protein
LSKPEQLSEIIARKSFSRAAKKSQRLELIRAGWESVAGDMAAHTLPTRLARGTLTVRTAGAAWASEASMSSALMLSRLERMLGKGAVRKIKVQAGAAGEAAVEPGSPDAEGQQCEEIPQGELGEKLGKIGDDEVRSALAKLAAASRTSKQSEQT